MLNYFLICYQACSVTNNYKFVFLNMTDIQKVILSIFNEIASICSKHCIPYYAIGGTCLGAIRHKGFIPWDDDLDIAIPIEFYDSFLSIAAKELPDNLYLYTANNVVHYHYVWAKICDKRTAFIEESEYCYNDAYKGVFVDIMPISGVPETTHRRNKFVRKIKLLDYLNVVRRFPIKPSFNLTSVLGYLIKVVVILFPFDFFSDKYLKELRRHPFSESVYTGYTWSSVISWLFFPTSWFGKGKSFQFEDITIICPDDCHRYLSFQFGDYMVPPPENEITTHKGIVDLVRPFTYYYDKLARP